MSNGWLGLTKLQQTLGADEERSLGANGVGAALLSGAGGCWTVPTAVVPLAATDANGTKPLRLLCRVQLALTVGGLSHNRLDVAKMPAWLFWYDEANKLQRKNYVQLFYNIFKEMLNSIYIWTAYV